MMREIGRCMGYDINDKENNILKSKLLKFDLEEFFRKPDLITRGLVIVTPKQIVGMEEDLNGDYCEMRNHNELAREIYKSIYPNRDLIDLGFDCVDWPSKIMNDGNILMYMMGGDLYSFCLIFLPEVISLDQYVFLEKFNARIKNIYNGDSIYFEEAPISFGVVKVCQSDNNIDRALNEIKDKISNNYSRDDEIVLGYDLELLRNDNYLNTNIKALRKK